MAIEINKAQFLPGEPVLVIDINQTGVVVENLDDPAGTGPTLVVVELESRCGFATAHPTYLRSGLAAN